MDDCDFGVWAVCDYVFVFLPGRGTDSAAWSWIEFGHEISARQRSLNGAVFDVGMVQCASARAGMRDVQRGGASHAERGSAGVEPGDSGDAGSSDQHDGGWGGVCVSLWKAAG